MQYRLIRTGFVGAMRQLIFAHVVDQHRTENTCNRPRRQQPPMNRTDVIGAEHVAKTRWKRGKSPAIHAQQYDRDRDEECDAVEVCGSGLWQEKVENRSKGKENEVRRFASDEIGYRRPEEASAHVEQAQQAH